MADDTRVPIASTTSSAPSSWGLGDGQAIQWEYAPAPESRDIVTLKPRYGLFIGGREVQAADGAVFTTIDPSTEEPLAEVARASAVDIDTAVKAARRASDKTWKIQDPQLPKSIWYHTDAQFLGFRIVRPLKVPAPAEMQAYWNSGVEKDDARLNKAE